METSRVVAKRMPDIANVAARDDTDMISWNSPIPAAPIRPDSHTWNVIATERISSAVPVSIAVLTSMVRIRFITQDLLRFLIAEADSKAPRL
jgi:hypothetical protein